MVRKEESYGKDFRKSHRPPLPWTRDRSNAKLGIHAVLFAAYSVCGFMT